MSSAFDIFFNSCNTKVEPTSRNTGGAAAETVKPPPALPTIMMTLPREISQPRKPKLSNATTQTKTTAVTTIESETKSSKRRK